MDLTARLTILINPRKKTLFERLCTPEDVIPSQDVKRLSGRYVEGGGGTSWTLLAKDLKPQKAENYAAGSFEAGLHGGG